MGVGDSVDTDEKIAIGNQNIGVGDSVNTDGISAFKVPRVSVGDAVYVKYNDKGELSIIKTNKLMGKYGFFQDDNRLYVCNLESFLENASISQSIIRTYKTLPDEFFESYWVYPPVKYQYSDKLDSYTGELETDFTEFTAFYIPTVTKGNHDDLYVINNISNSVTKIDLSVFNSATVCEYYADPSITQEYIFTGAAITCREPTSTATDLYTQNGTRNWNTNAFVDGNDNLFVFSGFTNMKGTATVFEIGNFVSGWGATIYARPLAWATHWGINVVTNATVDIFTLNATISVDDQFTIVDYESLTATATQFSFSTISPLSLVRTTIDGIYPNTEGFAYSELSHSVEKISDNHYLLLFYAACDIAYSLQKAQLGVDSYNYIQYHLYQYLNGSFSSLYTFPTMKWIRGFESCSVVYEPVSYHSYVIIPDQATSKTWVYDFDESLTLSASSSYTVTDASFGYLCGKDTWNGRLLFTSATTTTSAGSYFTNSDFYETTTGMASLYSLKIAGELGKNWNVSSIYQLDTNEFVFMECREVHDYGGTKLYTKRFNLYPPTEMIKEITTSPTVFLIPNSILLEIFNI